MPVLLFIIVYDLPTNKVETTGNTTICVVTPVNSIIPTLNTVNVVVPALVTIVVNKLLLIIAPDIFKLLT